MVMRKILFIYLSTVLLIACGKNSGIPEEAPDEEEKPPTTVQGKVKWHPGHYLEAYHPDKPDEYSAALSSPYMKGIQMRYRWRELEPEKGKYNFTTIDNNLTEVKAKGKRLLIYLLDQDYWGNNSVPDYMINDPAYSGGQVFKGNRCNPKFWEQPVMDRYIALVKALGAKYDSDPNFEGISTNERDIGAKDDSYSDRKYIDQIKRAQAAMVEAFPNSLVFESLGWTPFLSEVMDNVYNLGIGITCSDLVLPGNYSYDGRVWSQSPIYPYYISMRGKIPTGNSGQVGMQAAYGSGHSMDQIFGFAVGAGQDNLQLTHMMWAMPYDPPGFTFNGVILPYIASKEGYVANTSCPENIEKFRRGCNCQN
jgi:hypothetical protein